MDSFYPPGSPQRQQALAVIFSQQNRDLIVQSLRGKYGDDAAMEGTDQARAELLASLKFLDKFDPNQGRAVEAVGLIVWKHHARWRASDHAKESRKIVPMDPADLQPLVDEGVSEGRLSDPELVRLVKKVIGQLPPQERKVLELALNGHTNKEIAAILGISPGQVGVVKHDAIKKVQRMLQEAQNRAGDRIDTAVILCFQIHGGELTAARQEAFRRYYMEGLSLAETSRAMGITIQQCSGLLTAALEHLKKFKP